MRHGEHIFDRTPLRPDRLRRIDGSFAFLPHRFLRDGFWASLQPNELRLYVLLILVADQGGMSFYFDERLAAMLRLGLEDFALARRGLIKKDLIVYDPAGPRYQVLSLPPRPVLLSPSLPPAPTYPHPSSPPRRKNSDPSRHPPSTSSNPTSTSPSPVRQLVREWLASRGKRQE